MRFFACLHGFDSQGLDGLPDLIDVVRDRRAAYRTGWRWDRANGEAIFQKNRPPL